MSASTKIPRRVKTAALKPVYEPSPQTSASPACAAVPWWRTTWFLALASSFALWLPHSPLNASAIAWLAPLGWLLLIREEKLPGQRPYAVLYLAGAVHWLLVLEGIRRAYWALYLGWFALAFYLAVYLVLFVGLARVAVHRLRIPLCLAAPTIWVALELVRGYVVTGFSAALLAHTQSHLEPLIQIADLGGAYAVSFVVMFVAACLAQTFPFWFGRWQRWPVAAMAAVLLGVFAYGYGAMREVDALLSVPHKTLHVALLQNSVDTVFGVPLEKHVETYRAYQAQAQLAVKDHPETELLIWPESVFTSMFPEVVLDADATPPLGSNWTTEKFRERATLEQEKFAQHAQASAARIDRPQLVGSLTYRFANERVHTYNSALLISPEGKVEDHYYKMHRVMFGEYIPFGETFPWIYRLTPMAEGLSRGKEPAMFEVDGVTLAPSICFEDIVPQLIRGQILDLEAQRGRTPDVLVSITNDGWFWGSGLLDLHYKCAIFRAVEHRKPLVIAANTGFSAAIDPAGRVLAVGPRRQVATLAVPLAVPHQPLGSLYTKLGDWFAGLCLLLAVVCGGVGLARR